MAGISLIFIVGQVWLDLTMPDYMSEITHLVQTPGSAMGEIWLVGGMMLLCALGSLVFSMAIGFWADYPINERCYISADDYCHGTSGNY